MDAATDWAGLDREEQLVLADAQTSGGLLIATRDPEALEAALAARGVLVAPIGVVVAGPAGSIRVEGRLAS